MPNPTLLSLVLIHLIAGLATGAVSADRPAVSSAIFLGLIFSQTALLGIWTGLGSTDVRLRLGGFAVGTIYLAILCGWGINEVDPEVVVIVALPCILVALVAGGVRVAKGAIRRVDQSGGDRREALQFGIRHLMLLTFVVACLTLAGKLLAERIRGAHIMTTVLILGLCHAAVGVTAMWAMFGFGRPLARALVCMLIALCAGYLGGAFISSGTDERFWVPTAAIQAFVLLVSLQVVRSAGYRLVVT